MTLTWVYFVAAIFLYAGATIFIGVEEKQLTRAFGKEYADYLPRLIDWYLLENHKRVG